MIFAQCKDVYKRQRQRGSLGRRTGPHPRPFGMLHGGPARFAALRPVSYTHLDVYKRQVLERLANSGLLCKENTLLDYGCGKGRVDFFLSYQTRCHTIGVEYNERIYEKAIENREQGAAAGRTEFVLADAVQFSVPAEVDRIYFFNPFSIEILKKVLARVLESYYENPRELLLFFYYPSDEYISYLMTVDELIFSDEIDCKDLFPGENKRERIVVFEVG